MRKKPTYEELKKRVRELEKSNSERKYAVTALREVEKRYRSLFENNHAAMLVIDPETANIMDANPAAVSYYGWSKAELTRKKITDLNTLNKEQIYCEMEQAKTEKRNHFIFKHRLTNGDIRDVEVYSGPIEFHGSQLLFSIIHDVTERKHAEEQLAQMAQQWQTTFDTTRDAILVLDKDIRIQRVNKRATDLLDGSGRGLIGRHCWEIVHGTDHPVPECPNMRSMHSLRRESKELMINENWFKLSVDPILNDIGEYIGAVHIIADVNKRKLAEEALVQERDKLKIAIEQIKTLRGFLPICARCKKIRDDKGYWNQIEAYIRDHSEAEFSHSICPDCTKILYPDLDIFKG